MADPQNVLVLAENEDQPLFVDYVEFTSHADGEIKTSAYAPSQGGRFERDRFAVTKIIEEVLERSVVPLDDVGRIEEAIDKCRQGPPKNATLAPVVEAIRSALAPTSVSRLLKVVIPGAASGEMLSDEGQFGVGFDGQYLFIKGAADVLEFRLDRGVPVWGRRRSIDRTQAHRLNRFELGSHRASIFVDGTSREFDLPEVEELLEDPEILSMFDSDARMDADEGAEGLPSALLTGDPISEDAVSTLVDLEDDEAVREIDIPRLWRQLMEVEERLTTEGVATGDSGYRKDVQRHIVPFSVETGTLDFDRNDQVLIERLDHGGRWTKIGYLDVSATTPNLLYIDTTSWSYRSERLVSEDQRLRFRSHMEFTSRSRRQAAVSRILNRQSVVRNLVDYFDPRGSLFAVDAAVPVEAAEVQAAYGLNGVQAKAFVDIVNARPLGLLQGPPGTGKTKFIGALIHFVLTRGYARNVLLASQSREAVNNAAEAILKLYPPPSAAPSILRVGQEGNVSEQLLPYHVARVESLYKDRFRATLERRLSVAASSLGVPDGIARKLIALEVVIRPVVEQIQYLTAEEREDRRARLTSLEYSLEGLLTAHDVDADVGDATDTEFLSTVARKVGKSGGVSEDAVRRFSQVAKLGRDICGSVSTRERSFETFLAGTRQIVAGTCVGLGRASLGLTSTPFDLVVIDEAARCLASELAVPMQAGRWVVLVGDHKQLPPQTRADIVKVAARETGLKPSEIIRSDFERVFESRFGRDTGRRITTQYRMLPPIGRVVSRCFYGGELEHGRPDSTIPQEVLPSFCERALTWVYTDGLGEAAFQSKEREGRTSLYNTVEADMIVSMIKRWSTHAPFTNWLASREEVEPAIGIICTYAAQAALIRHKLSR